MTEILSALAHVRMCNRAQCIGTVCSHYVACTTMVQYNCVYSVGFYFQDQSESELLIATRLCELDLI